MFNISGIFHFLNCRTKNKDKDKAELVNGAGPDTTAEETEEPKKKKKKKDKSE